MDVSVASLELSLRFDSRLFFLKSNLDLDKG